MKEKEDQVRRMLKEAFKDVPCPEEWRKAAVCGPLSHEDCLYFRKSFYNYKPEEVHYMLPFLLEDLMDTRTGDDVKTEDAEYLVMSLNPLAINNPVILKHSIKQFENFTQEQAQAICEWLHLARSWNDLSIFIKEVDAAIRYWCNCTE